MVPHPPAAVPEIGGDDIGSMKKTLDSYRRFGREIAELRPDTIIISSPHAESYSDYFQFSDGEVGLGDFRQFGASSISFRVLYDTELTQAISDECAAEGFPAGNASSRERKLDHGTMVPLYFINEAYTSYHLVRLGLSGMSIYEHYRLGQLIGKVAERSDKRIVYVASGDLSHCQKDDGPYGYHPEGPKYDDLLMKIMGNANFGGLLSFDKGLLDKAEQCGHRSFAIMAGALDRKSVTVSDVSHEAPFGIGYGFATYMVTGQDNSRAFGDICKNNAILRRNEKMKNADAVLRLAYEAVEHYLRYHEKMRLDPLSDRELTSTRAGCFVSIHEFGSLRGCIGTVRPRDENLGMEIIDNAISACRSDDRFSPIEEGELPFLEISVDVLSELEPIKSLSQLDPKKYGVLVVKGYRSGVLLPNLKGVDTPEEQVRIAKKKADIEIDETPTMYRFTTVRHE